ncbi:MAG TPA: DUF1398 family protein [Candidatus Aquilonibacter sp.]|nr:DUF1398 family protein [Candidatus Aquilonibacter sp.]
MDQQAIEEAIGKVLARKITFAELLGTLMKEGLEAYHVDFVRNEFRYYARGGESLVLTVALRHDGVAPEFSADKLEAINKRVQAGEAGYADFVREATAAGCAFYIVYLYGKKVRYFGRDGDECIQYFPGARQDARSATN